jgi:hypothetical protein
LVWGVNAARRNTRYFFNGSGDGIGLLVDSAASVAVGVGYELQDTWETWASIAVDGGKVGTTEEGLLVWGKKYSERPSAIAPEELDKELVDVIEVGAFFAVDFDVDKEVVHERGDGLVFEAFVRHDVAPVARGVADGKENRLIETLGGGEGLGAPGEPIDGIGGVLEEVGRDFVDEAVSHGSFEARWRGSDALNVLTGAIWASR